MFKQLLVVGLLFAVGVSFGAVFTPVGIELMETKSSAPVKQKPHSKKTSKALIS